MSREAARAKLKKLEELKEKWRERARLELELEESLLHEAYENRQHRAQGRPGHGPLPRRTGGPEACGRCGWQFVPGETVREYLDDDGKVVARYHLYPAECAQAHERHPEARL